MKTIDFKSDNLPKNQALIRKATIKTVKKDDELLNLAKKRSQDDKTRFREISLKDL